MGALMGLFSKLFKKNTSVEVTPETLLQAIPNVLSFLN